MKNLFICALVLFCSIFITSNVFSASYTDDACTGEFSSGTQSDTECVSDTEQLDATGISNGSGTFTSRIFDTAATSTWDTFSWQTNFPVYKELLDNGATETGYTTGTIDMSQSTLLLHLNESSGASTFTDDSGDGTHDLHV